MATLDKAIAIAAEGFVGVFDKGGQPYILHCLRVMNDLHSRNQELQSIAVLHDVIEDGVCDFDDLYKYGFSVRVIEGIRILTKTPSTSYDDYIKIIALNSDARLVKLSDLKDNTKVTRLKGLSKKDLDRMEKYFRAYTYLQNI